MVVEIELSKKGTKYKGLYKAIVDDIDKDLAELNWVVLHNKYAQREVKGEKFLMHRIILERILGRNLERGEVVDHANGNAFDNTRENLRLATVAQNSQNSKTPSTNKSGYKGVSWFKRDKKWIAFIRCNGKSMNLGCYDTPEEAHEVYKAKAMELFGEFARFE